MDVRTCKKCGRLFNYLSGLPLCPSCRDELEKSFAKVKDYIWSKPGATMQQISEDNDVPVQQLRQWIREERLEFTQDSPIHLTCENCGADIRTGRYCDACKSKMASTFKASITDPTEKMKQKRNERLQKEEDKMRFMKH